MYDYYADALPGLLEFFANLFGLGGDKDRGTDYVAKAYRKGVLTRHEAGFFLGKIYGEQGDYEEAQRIYGMLEARFPQNVYLLVESGINQFQMYHFREAELIFKRVLRICGSEYDSAQMFANFYLGRIERLRNRFEQSSVFFERVLTLAGDRELLKMIDGWMPGVASYHLAENSEQLGQTVRARELYEAACTHVHAPKGLVKAGRRRIEEPRSRIELDFNRWRHMIVYGDYKAGLDGLLKFSAEHDRHVRTLEFYPLIAHYSGRAYIGLQNPAQAALSFETALKQLEKQDAEDWAAPFTWYYLAKCYQELGQLDRVKECLDRADDFAKYRREKRLKFLIKKIRAELR